MESTQIVHSNGQNQFIQTPNGQMIIAQTTDGQYQQYGHQVIQNTNQQTNVASTPTHQGQGQQQTLSQPTPVIYHTQQHSHKYDNFSGSVSIGLGMTQVIIGIFSIIMGGVDIGGQSGLYFVGHGFWNGLFFLLSGYFGIGAGYYKMKCQVIAFMCLNIISAAVFAPAMIMCGSFGLMFASSGYNFDYNRNAHDLTMSLVAEGTLLCLGILEFIISIISAAVCCHGACCCAGHRGVVWPAQYLTVTNNGQGFQASQHPQVVVLQTPTMTGGQSGIMYMQPGTSYLAQPSVMQQPPAYTNQVPAYESQAYSNPPDMAQATKQ